MIGRFTGDTKQAIAVVLGLLLVMAVMGSWYTVEQGDRALVLRFGKVINTVEPGLNFKIPLMDTVVDISVRTRKREDLFAVYSKDIQSAAIKMSINYALNPASVAEIYTRYGSGYEDRIIIPQIMAKAKDVFGQYNAVEIVQSREKLAAKVSTELQAQFVGTGIVVESVQIENIDFSDEYERSVEERMKAEVEVQKVRQNLEREKLNADMVRTKARGEADARIMSAESEAKAIALRGAAEAEAIKAKSQALSQNPSYVQLIQAERWDGSLPKTMPPLSTLPILNVAPDSK